MADHYSEKLPIPAIILTPDGNLPFEWTTPGEPSVEIHLGSMTADFHAFGRAGTEVEREFDLANNEAWPEFFAFLSEHIEQLPA